MRIVIVCWKREAGELFLQGDEFGPLSCGKEAIVADLHEVGRENMLEETLDEFLGRESAVFEQAVVGGAVREAMEELGIAVAIKQKVAEIHVNGRVHHYFLVEQIGGEFGTGTGEEYTDSHPDDPETGVYIPIRMAVGE